MNSNPACGHAICEIRTQPICINQAIEAVRDVSHGAIDTFLGVVRNHHQGKAVTGITYDVHSTLAVKVLDTICSEANSLWPGTRYYVAHYHGKLAVGGISVVIAVGSAHRAASFEACRYVIEAIKKRAPIWKQEHYPDGKSEWLPGHSLLTETTINTDDCNDLTTSGS
ncbi:MAG: molybdenum cofactor biosynthesis protein MoaE [Gammaproteobacteria bacterium]